MQKSPWEVGAGAAGPDLLKGTSREQDNCRGNLITQNKQLNNSTRPITTRPLARSVSAIRVNSTSTTPLARASWSTAPFPKSFAWSRRLGCPKHAPVSRQKMCAKSSNNANWVRSGLGLTVSAETQPLCVPMSSAAQLTSSGMSLNASAFREFKMAKPWKKAISPAQLILNVFCRKAAK